MTPGRTFSTIGLVGAGLILSASSCSETPPARLQGWSDAQRSAWYEATQGSRLMPWSWIQALEQAGNNQPFLEDEHMAGFRFVLRTTTFGARLPIGFALDGQDDRNLSFTRMRWFKGQEEQARSEKWIGLNCSACHTGQITHGSETVTVDGAPSLVDFQSFIEAVDAALTATRDDPAKWDRFAAKVLAGKDDPANRDMLKTALGSLIAWEKENERLNATPLRYGYGRLDAFGHIFNKVSQLAVYQMPAPAAPAIANAADAPVSYPFLWNIFRQSKLQWNGIVPTARLKLGNGNFLDYGALGRNTGEVIGVFGDVWIPPGSGMTGLPSSVETKNLDRLEVELRKLEPPVWPASFGAPDQTRVDAGKTLFAQKGCIGCHQIEAPGTSIYQIKMVPLTRDSQGNDNRNNTDPWMACNAISYLGSSGKLKGKKEGYVSGRDLGAIEPLATLLSTTVKGALVAQWQDLLSVAANTFFGVERLPRVITGGGAPEARRAERLGLCFKANSPLFAYKARPLDGIWATAPYLHNGSVRTLYDLLLAPDQRPTSFVVGGREYDTQKVGYVSGSPAGNFTFDTTKSGNSRLGHDYNVGALTEEERWALVEYMKTL